MSVSPSERQRILAELSRLATEDLNNLWTAAERLDTTDFARFVTDGFSDVIDPYAATAGEIAAVWYDDSAPDLDYQAVPAGMPDVTALNESAAWALGATGEAALARMAGTLQRSVFNAARDTILDNTDREPGSRWARHASANACEFCKMLASRSVGRNATFYSSENAASRVVGRGQQMSLSDRRLRAAGQTRDSSNRFIAGGTRPRGTRELGGKYHDHCHCVAIEIRPGTSYEAAPYVERFEQEYIQARNAAGSGNVKDILAAWRQLPTAS